MRNIALQQPDRGSTAKGLQRRSPADNAVVLFYSHFSFSVRIEPMHAGPPYPLLGVRVDYCVIVTGQAVIPLGLGWGQVDTANSVFGVQWLTNTSIIK
jgi:hypothetical protein